MARRCIKGAMEVLKRCKGDAKNMPKEEPRRCEGGAKEVQKICQKGAK